MDHKYFSFFAGCVYKDIENEYGMTLLFIEKFLHVAVTNAFGSKWPKDMAKKFNANLSNESPQSKGFRGVREKKSCFHVHLF